MKRRKKWQPVGVLSKTFRLLEIIKDSRLPPNLTELSRRAGLNKSTALRFLAHLEAEGYLRRDERSRYHLGPRLLELGQAAASSQAHLREVARPLLWELWRETQETVNLGILEGFEVAYVDCLESPHDLRLVTNVSMRAVYYRTALGKAIAAFLPEPQLRSLLESVEFQAFTPNTLASPELLLPELERIRRTGYAVDNEESVPGIRCVAAPVLNAEGLPAAAVSVSGPTVRITPDSVPELAAAVIRTAQRISKQLPVGRAVNQIFPQGSGSRGAAAL